MLPQPPNPIDYIPSEDFQTKDLGETMSNFEIREDGTLWKKCAEYEYPDPPKASKRSKFWDFPIPKLIREWEEQQLITQTIFIYDYYHDDDSEFDYGIEYKLVFVEGRLQKSELIKFENWPNAERKKLRAVQEARMKADNEFRKGWFYKLFYKYYMLAVIFVCRRIVRFGSYLSSNGFKWESFLRWKV
jgi:hypothetical protein